MPTRIFRVTGSVIDTASKKGLSGMRVEIWNSDAAQHAVLGAALTDSAGNFDIAATAEVSSDPIGGATGVVPATMHVFLADQPLAVSGETKIPDLFKFRGPAVLQVHPAEPQKELKDRVTADQVFQVFDFVQQSNFKGVYREGRTRVTSVGSLLKSSLTAAAGKFVLKPVNPPQVRTADVVNQDSLTASRRLDQQQVKVASVQPYKPGMGTIGDVTSIGATLKPGDTVDLFEENGIVKSYRIQRPAKAADTTKLTTDVNALQGDVNRLQTRQKEIDDLKLTQQQQTETINNLTQKAALVDNLQAQLTRVQTESAQKDETITKLQSDVATVTRAHAELSSKVTPDRLVAMEAAIKKLQRIP